MPPLPLPKKWIKVPTLATLYLLRNNLIFAAKAMLLKGRRVLHNRFVTPVTHHRPQAIKLCQPAIAQSITPLWTETSVDEQALTLGKIQNLRVAIANIQNVTVPAGQIFSFWAQVGAPIRSRGYVVGRELRQGCIVPSIGGGLCQLSNALYSAALDAGLEILERHAHSKVIPGSLAEVGRDATVFWNYVDLRFKAPYDLTIEAYLTQTDLVVTFYGEAPTGQVADGIGINENRERLSHTHSCWTCGNRDCAKSELPKPQVRLGKTHYLVDEYWPEFDRYLQTQRTQSTEISIPLNGQRFRKPNYQWSIASYQNYHTATFTALSRGYACRKLQGQSLQQVLFKYDRQLAEQYAQQLDYDVTHIVVAQNLLPFLWQMGVLGGRSFDVLMTRLPLVDLQRCLDQAAKAYPDSPTLNDFRVYQDFILAETQALLAARKLITPHSEIATIYPQKTQHLDWDLPSITPPHQAGHRILFPASTLGRSGCYEMRSAAQALGLELTLAGSILESKDFWGDIPIHKPQQRLLDEVGLVILPAYVHHKPRLLLRAIASGIPVTGLPGVTIVPAGKLEPLIDAINRSARCQVG
jgi:hypothetical protein